MANEVFISYSRKDFEKVKTVKEEIDSLVGIDCWMDLNGIESGDWFKRVIISAINKHNTLLFMLTPNSMNSQFAMKELGFAASKGKRIVLVDLENTQLNDEFLFDYSDKDNVDWNDSLQHEKLINNLQTWFPVNFSKKENQDEYPTFFSKEKIPTINVLFLVDCSGSMMGRRMEEVNQACSEVFRDFDIINPDVEIKVDVLMFGTNVSWMSPTPVPIEEFIWTPLVSGGMTSFGEACSELNRKMNRKEFFANNNIVKKSLLVLITDGEPTDYYDKPFQDLQLNPYFMHSNRFAIGIGGGFNKCLLTKFAGVNKVFTLPDNGEGPRLKPLLERIMHIGLYAASYTALDEIEVNDLLSQFQTIANYLYSLTIKYRDAINQGENVDNDCFMEIKALVKKVYSISEISRVHDTMLFEKSKSIVDQYNLFVESIRKQFTSERESEEYKYYAAKSYEAFSYFVETIVKAMEVSIE